MGGTYSAPFEFFSLDRFAGAAALQEAEQMDQYRSKCAESRMNATARPGAYEPAADATAAANDYDLLAAFGKMPAWLKAGSGPVRIVWLNPAADGGLPHTRAPNIICMPAYYPADKLQTTLHHELLHVHQRMNLEKWLNIYSALGYEPWYGELPPDLERQRRINPDTILMPLFIWHRRWVAVPAFKSTYLPRLNETRVMWYDVGSDIWYPHPPAEWTTTFGEAPTAVQEHPHELAAYWLSEPNIPETPAYRALSVEIRRRFGDN